MKENSKYKKKSRLSCEDLVKNKNVGTRCIKGIESELREISKPIYLWRYE